MHNNDVLRSIADALAIDDARIVDIFALGNAEVTVAEVEAYKLHHEDPASMSLPGALLSQFLDGYIVEQRGPREDGRPAKPNPRMNNNAVLKKLRIALNLHEEEVLRILDEGGQPMRKRDLGAYFRKPQNSHFRACPDAVLTAFIEGLPPGLGTKPTA